jgi:hypothetical protein
MPRRMALDDRGKRVQPGHAPKEKLEESSRHHRKEWLQKNAHVRVDKFHGGIMAWHGGGLQPK